VFRRELRICRHRRVIDAAIARLMTSARHLHRVSSERPVHPHRGRRRSLGWPYPNGDPRPRTHSLPRPSERLLRPDGKQALNQRKSRDLAPQGALTRCTRWEERVVSLRDVPPRKRRGVRCRTPATGHPTDSPCALSSAPSRAITGGHRLPPPGRRSLRACGTAMSGVRTLLALLFLRRDGSTVGIVGRAADYSLR
jgi:hypothetical protein